jgi:hypothetical protein
MHSVYCLKETAETYVYTNVIIQYYIYLQKKKKKTAPLRGAPQNAALKARACPAYWIKRP